jgi:hypothetical protein
MPLPAPDPDEVIPEDLQQLADYMRQRYTETGQWWQNLGSPNLHEQVKEQPLPDDLLDDLINDGTGQGETPP